MTGLRERQKKHRRDSILSVAETLFQERGYDETRIVDIAELAGVSAVTVFNYYKTKGELLLALIAQENATLTKRLRKISVRSGKTAPEQACAFFEAVTEESLRHVDKKAWRQVIATSITFTGAEFGLAYNRLRGELKASFLALLKSLAEKKLLRTSGDIDTLADLVYAYHYQLFIEFVANDDRTLSDYKHALRRGIAMLLPVSERETSERVFDSERHPDAC